MAISLCSTTTDHTGRELTQHGTFAFPIACYQDDFRVMDVPWHWHEELEAAIVTDGSCTVAAGNEKYLLTKGQGFFVNAGILHGCWDREHTGCMFHSLVFLPRLVGGSPDSIFHQRYLQPLTGPSAPEIIILSPDIPWQKAALEAIETAWQHCVSEEWGCEFQTRDALSQLVLLLCSHLGTAGQEGGSRNIRDTERIKLMLSYIHTHYPEELTAASIAASATISESECLRCFRSTIGTTPIQYLRQYRIRQAAAQLAASAERIEDVAAGCGFQDMSYFSKIFRQIHGCTPTQYRRQKANP